MVGKGYVRQVLMLLLLVLVIGCKKEDDMVVAFIGDSITERWDLQAAFPSILTQNYGLNGAGISHVKFLAHKMKGKQVVILIGTNDNHNWDVDYVDIYADAVINLNALDVTIVSILPRKAKGDRELINADIESVNTDLKTMAAEYGWKYVDAFPLFLKDDTINKNCYTDGLHLSAHGYEILGYEIRRVLR